MDETPQGALGAACSGRYSIPESMSDRLWGRRADQTPEKMPDKMPEQMPNRMSECTWGRLPDAMPEKRQNTLICEIGRQKKWQINAR